VDAQVTLKASPREFDLLRSAVDDTIEGLKQDLYNSTDFASKKKTRETMAEYMLLKEKM